MASSPGRTVPTTRRSVGTRGREARRQARYERAWWRGYGEGHSLEVARRAGVNRGTVRRYVRAGHAPVRAQPTTAGVHASRPIYANVGRTARTQQRGAVCRDPATRVYRWPPPCASMCAAGRTVRCPDDGAAEVRQALRRETNVASRRARYAGSCPPSRRAGYRRTSLP